MTVKQVRELILWLRHQRIAYTTLSAGGVTLDGVTDLKAEQPTNQAKSEPRQSMYERYGEELLRQPAAKPTDAIPDEAMID